MRVSDSMFNDLTTANVGDRRQEVFEAQRVAQTGMKVERPSDDPVAAAQARVTKSRERRAEAVIEIGGEALDRFEAVDGVLHEVGNLLSRARELATQGANDHLSANDRLDMATEVSVLRQQLLSMANTKIEGEYVFGGMAVDREPFDVAGIFSGEATVRELELGPGVRLPTQVSGGEIFGATAGTNAFGTLEALEDALRQNDSDAVHALLDDLDAASAQVAHGRASGGAAQQGLIQASAVAERIREEAIRRRVDLTEADPVAAFTELVRAQGALRDALTIAQQLPPPSILNGG